MRVGRRPTSDKVIGMRFLERSHRELVEMMVRADVADVRSSLARRAPTS
jgi:hypothetical protein